MILTVRPTPADTISSVLTELEGENRTREPSRADPSTEVLGLGPAFEHQLTRRAEYTLDGQQALGRVRPNNFTSCVHAFSPGLASPAGIRRGDRNFPPKTGDTFPANRLRP